MTKHDSDPTASQRIRCGVIGCKTIMPIEGTNRSLEEILYDLTQGVLADAGLAIDDIDGIVVAANDQLDGRAIAIMAASGSVGGVGRDILSTPSSAEHAFVLGALRVASGCFRTQLVIAWSPLEAENIPEALRLAADPYFHRALPLDEWSAHALQAGRLEASVPDAAEAARQAAARNRRNGVRAFPAQPASLTKKADGDMFRWPLTHAMVSPPVGGAVAMVIASEEFVAERKATRPAWIRGIGWAAETGFLGDRDLATLPGLAVAAEKAYREAGVADPRTAFALAEVTDITPHQELLALEGLGLCGREEWLKASNTGSFDRDGPLPVNVSGGAQTFNPIFCTGLMRIAELVDQIRGRAGSRQVEDVGLAVAHAASGPAMQYNTVVVLGRDSGAVL